MNPEGRCGPKTLSPILGISVDEAAELCKHDETGTRPINMVLACKDRAAAYGSDTLDEISQYLDKAHAVILWQKKDENGLDGHYSELLTASGNKCTILDPDDGILEFTKSRLESLRYDSYAGIDYIFWYMLVRRLDAS